MERSRLRYEPSILMNEIPGLAPYFAYLLDAYEGTNDGSQVAEALAEALRGHDSN